MSRILSPFALPIALSFVGAACGQVQKGSWTPAVETMARGYTSISYWTYRDDGVEIGGGRISIEHGMPNWWTALDNEGAFERATRNRIWRLGDNKWTTLDTQLPLVFESRRIEAGIYYLGAKRTPHGNWSLVLVDPAAVRASKIDAWAFVARPEEVPILLEIPLKHRIVEQRAQRLQIALSLIEGSQDQARVRIHWGPHLLEATMQIQVPSPDFYKSKQ